MSTTPDIVPVIWYQDVPAAIRWLTGALGFTVQAESRDSNGAIVRAMLRFEAGVLDVRPASAVAHDPLWRGLRQAVFVSVADADDHCQRARQSGAEVVVEPHAADGGSREYSVRDSGGYLWTFGTSDTGAGTGEVRFVPELRYRDLGASVEWLTRAFGFDPTLEVPGPDGRPIHAEMRSGDGTIFLSPLPDDRADGWGDITQFVNVIVDNPDHHHGRAALAGARIVMAPRDTPFGARFYAVRDPESFLWWISTYRPAKPGIAPAHT